MALEDLFVLRVSIGKRKITNSADVLDLSPFFRVNYKVLEITNPTIGEISDKTINNDKGKLFDKHKYFRYDIDTKKSFCGEPEEKQNADKENIRGIFKRFWNPCRGKMEHLPNGCLQNRFPYH